MQQITRISALIFLLIFANLPALAEKKSAHGHHDFPTAVAGFHDVMAPLWHAPAGEQRNKNICAQYPDLVKKAKKIRSADVPKKVNPAAWKKAIKDLRTVLTPIEKHCAEGRSPEYALANVHHGFHELVRLVGHQH